MSECLPPPGIDDEQLRLLRQASPQHLEPVPMRLADMPAAFAAVEEDEEPERAG